MKLSSLTRWLWFLSSWLPALLLWMLLALPGAHLWAGIFLMLGLLSLLMLYMVIREMIPAMMPISSRVTVLREKSKEVQSYLLWYVLPLLIQPWVSIQQAFALLVVFALVGIIYVRGNLLHVNPFLLALGFRLYEVKLEGDERTYLLLAHKQVALGMPLHLVHLTDDLLWAREEPTL